MCLVFVAGALLYQSSQKQIKICMFEITSDARIWFQMASWATCRWLSGTNNWVRAHAGDVIIVWRNTHNNTETDAIWFPATLTDTALNIQGIRVKYRTNGNCNLPATESRPWESKWYHLFSAQVCMLRRGALGIFIQRFSIEHSRTASPGAVLQRANLHKEMQLMTDINVSPWVLLWETHTGV